MAPVNHLVRIYSPAFARQPGALHAVAALNQRMGGQTRTEYGSDILLGPCKNFSQGLPEILFLQMSMSDVCAADDQRIQSVPPDLLERIVIFADMGPGFRTSLQPVYREWMYMKLGYLVTGADQAEKLSFGGFQRGVRHDVQQADMKFAYRLVAGAFGREDFLAFFL